MIQQSIVNSFRFDLLMRMATDTFRMALYTADAMLSEATPAYQTTDEVIGPGYSAGGIVLTGFVVGQDGRFAFASWTDPVWPISSITARGALIYNATQANRAVAVLDLGQNYTSTNGKFTVALPELTVNTALIRIG